MDDALVEIRNPEKVALTDAAIMDIITHYCGHEAGVRNLKKCLDRVFRKIVAKIDMKEQKDGEVEKEATELEY
jgi:ATP-dependent Lon protease